MATQKGKKTLKDKKIKKDRKVEAFGIVHIKQIEMETLYLGLVQV